ncbi:Heat shock transcription factor [Coemansia sp. RSA 989]|nr:Heat shock transcription factor [Coemansia sp. RSA 989]
MSGVVSRRANNVHRNITVTPFLNKLYSMVDDSSSDDLIRWSADGNSFVVLRHEDFAKEVLPRFFKHSNFSSFVRQLNMYGFHKVPHLQQGGLIADGPEAESWEFNNENFQRGQPDLLHFIRRKKGSRDSMSAGQDGTSDANLGEEDAFPESDGDDNTRVGSARLHTPTESTHAARGNAAGRVPAAAAAAATATGKGEANGVKTRTSRAPPVNLARILKEIQVIRDHQLTISSDIKRLQEENQSLWMQASATEERYNKHQETIDKILRFLATIFSADARHSEIQPPLRRMISHKGKGAQGAGSSGSHPTSTSAANMGSARDMPMRSAWSQNVFEDMDFPDVLSTEQPPDKRQRTSKMTTSSNIYELPPNNSAAASPQSQTSPARESGSATNNTSSRDVRRKTSNLQQSTALTRSQPRPLLNTSTLPQYTVPYPSGDGNSGSGESNALVMSPTGSYSKLNSHSKSIKQLQQEVDSLGLSVENLTRLLQSGMMSQMLNAPSLSTTAASGAAADTPVSSAYIPPSSGTENYSALLGSQALDSLMAASLVDPALSSVDAANNPSLFPATDDSLLTSHPDMSTGINSTAEAANAFNNPSSLESFDPSTLQAMLQSCTPEQYDYVQNYLRLLANPSNAHLLTDSTSSGIEVEPPKSANETPFLDFVDPNAEPAIDLASNYSTAAESMPAASASISADAVSKGNDFTQILFSAFNGSTGSPSTALGSVDIPASIPNTSNGLDYSVLQSLTSAPLPGDGLGTAVDRSAAEPQQKPSD